MRRFSSAVAILLLGVSGLAVSAERQEDLERAASFFAGVIAPLAKAVASGDDKSCRAVSITVSGLADKGARFYASAPLADFSSSVRSASKKARLSKAQAKAFDSLIKQAEASADGTKSVTSASVESFHKATGMAVELRQICVSSETISFGAP